MPASDPKMLIGLDRQHDDLLVRRISQLPERLDVFVGDEIIQRGDVALGDGFGDHLGRLGLGFGGALARLGVAERGFAAAFGLQYLALLGAFRAQDFRLALAFGLQNVGALDALGLHLASHRLDQIGRRHDVLDLDAVDLQPQGDTAASTTRSRRSLISSRCDSTWSRSIAPITERILVIVSTMIAWLRLETS
jgi:hypothetical protein